MSVYVWNNIYRENLHVIDKLNRAPLYQRLIYRKWYVNFNHHLFTTFNIIYMPTQSRDIHFALIPLKSKNWWPDLNPAVLSVPQIGELTAEILIHSLLVSGQMP